MTRKLPLGWGKRVEENSVAQQSKERRSVVEVLLAFLGKLVTVEFQLIFKVMISNYFSLVVPTACLLLTIDCGCVCACASFLPRLLIEEVGVACKLID